MVIKTASPGVYIQEIDLTRGILDPITRNNGILAGPFERGPVGKAVKVQTEVDFRQTFGGPTNENYEYWWTVDNFLEYGGQCYIVRCDDAIGDEIDSSIELGEENDSIDGRHPQKMRNATDAYEFDVNDPADPTKSDVYMKNEEEFESTIGEVIPGAGKFFGRNPGTWMNGVGVAVIDRGADYQLLLDSENLALSLDGTIFINGGNAETNYEDTLNGGQSNIVIQDPQAILDRNLGRKTRAFDPSIISGQRLVQYAKLRSTKTGLDGEPSDEIIQSAVTSVEMVSGGSGYVSNDPETLGATTGYVFNVECTASAGDSTGQNLFLDLYIEGGVVTSSSVNLRGATGPLGWEEDEAFVADGVENADDDDFTAAAFTVAEIRETAKHVIRIGTAEDGITGTIVRREADYYIVAVAPKNNGTFGEVAEGQRIEDPAIPNTSLGDVETWVVLGYYQYYGSDRGNLLDVIWEPESYTREEGMEWLWPNRPFGGETVYKTKTALNVNGAPIKLPGSTPDAPIYKRLEGPAQLTSASGDTIAWSATRERWLQTYVPKEGDIVYDNYSDPDDPESIVTAYEVMGSADWYSQQIAFEGLPWIQFAPRPRTSAHAQDLGCEDDEMNVIVYDAQGNHDTMGGAAARKGRVLETYYQVSKFKGALTVEGANNYYKDLINTQSQIIYANEPVHIIGSTFVDDDPEGDQNISINAGRVYPGTQIKTGLKAALLQQRYGSIDESKLGDYTSSLSPAGVKTLNIVNAGTGFSASMINVPTYTDEQDPANNNTTLFVDIDVNDAGVVVGVSPTPGKNGSGYYYGQEVYVNSDSVNGTPAKFSVNTLTDSPKAPYLLLGGEDQLSASLGELQQAYRKVLDENIADLDYILQGPAFDNYFFATLAGGDFDYGQLPNETRQKDQLSFSIAKANQLIAIGEEVKTAMVLLSPPKSAALDPLDAREITDRVVEWADRIASSSYAVMDSGYKRMYDRFREKFIYVPLNGDIAGCMTRTSLVSQPFFSPGGLNRGQIKNVERLSYDPSKAQRDTLYSHRVNPVVTFPGEGTVLYGDKTTLAYSSAFQRINVRRLFIYCERVISEFAREVLFEFNDVPTRLNFVNTVNPFMTDVVSKRGATDFLVVCDSSNNTPEVIDRNEFVADIYIKPNRSINFVQLTFVATKTGVSFSEAIGTTRLTNN